MKNKINGESLAGVVIGVFILSFSMLGMINILGYNEDIISDYNVIINEYILKGNNDNIIAKLDISNIEKNEKFYLYKNKSTKKYDIFTGGTNSEYKFINPNGDYVTSEESIGNTYIREFTKKIDILKHIIYPDQIENLVFLYDATNIDGSNNSTLSDGDSISIWNDLVGTENAYQNTSSRKPKYLYDGIEGLGGVKFDGIDDVLKLNKNSLINNDDICLNETVFNEKSYAIVLKTGFDVTSDQVVFEQGGEATGYNFMIHNGDLYAGIHNKAYVGGYTCFENTDHEWDTGHKFKSVNLGEILPDSTYFIMIVQDSTHKYDPGSEISNDKKNKLKIYLNGNLASETDHVDPQPEHHLAGLGSINEWNVRPWSPYSTIKSGDGNGGCDDHCLYFDGFIGEFISWNHALSKHEIRGIQNYFTQKWLRGKSNIIYNIVDTNIKKYNP